MDGIWLAAAGLCLRVETIVYPKDFYNLVDVYLDAVLYPNCVRDPKTFAQEGWHYELEDLKARIPFARVGTGV